MKKTVSVHMLPSDKATRLVKRDEICGLEYHQNPQNLLCGWQYLYFTTDEEITEPCWVLIFPETGNLLNIALRYISIPENPKYFDTKGGSAVLRHICKKVIATTNPKLWVTKVPDSTWAGRPNTFNTILTGIAKIPDSFIQAYIKAYNEGKPITQIMLEYGDVAIPNSQRTATVINPVTKEEKKLVSELRKEQLKLNSDDSVIWSLKKEKVYTRSKVLSIANAAFYHRIDVLSWDTVDWDEWEREYFDKNYPQ